MDNTTEKKTTINSMNKISGNAYQGRTLKRMELSYQGTTVKFAVNPEDYTQKEPNKVTLTQTKGGAWIDAWGAGVVEFTIKGITGVKGSGGTSIDVGYQRWIELRNLFRKLYGQITDGQEVTDLIKFYNFTDNEYFYCYPTQAGLELYRSKSRPHIYQYTINLWGIRKMGQAEVSSGVIGNPLKKKSTNNSKTVTSKTKTVTISGGKVYTSRSVSLDTGADQSTYTNTKTKTMLDIQEDCLEYLTQLEPLIGGKGGKISPATGYGCIQNLTIQSSGTVSNVNPFTGDNLADDPDFLLKEVKFTSKISIETVDMYKNIKAYSPDVLSPAYSLSVGPSPTQRVIQAIGNSTAYDSSIYELIVKYQPTSILSKTEINHLKLILLESMMIYRELYDLYNQTESLSTFLTSSSLQTLIDNIRAMIMYFTFNSTEKTQMYKQDVSVELRHLEKLMTQISTDIVDYL